MKPLRVLLVSYSFPPAGGVGVLRAASLARYLPAEDIELDVLTARNASAVGTDTRLLSKIPAAVRIQRTITLDLPFRFKKALKKLIVGAKPPAGPAAAAGNAEKRGLLKRIVQDLLLPDPQVTWLPVLARAAHRIVKARNIDLVLITVPPFSSVLLVEKLRREFPLLPIVVDFRDEWLSTTIDLVSFSRSARALRVARRAEASAVLHATAVVAVTEVARREIHSRYPHEPESKFHLIPNGFDAEGLRESMPAVALAAPFATRRTDDRIVLAYVGTVYGSTEPTALVEALQSLPAEVKSCFRLRFIGHIEEPRYRAALLGLGAMVELTGFLRQDQALAAMGAADYALLITHDPLNVAAKFYDYVGAGKPILATVHPQGEVRRLLEELGAGWWVDSRDVEAIRRLFIEVATNSNGLLARFRPERERIAQYERMVIAQRYARLLHRTAGRPGQQLELDTQPAPRVLAAEQGD